MTTTLSTEEQNQVLLDLARRERHLAVELVIELASFAQRERHRELGYGSLFYYCMRQLGLSKATAFRRSEAALLVARVPAAGALLRGGRLSIRALVELREVLTEDNSSRVLARAEGMTQEQAQLLAVEIKPKPIPRDVARAVSKGAPAVALAASPAQPMQQTQPASALDVADAPRPSVPAETRVAKEVVAPLTPALRRLNVTVSAAFMERLKLVRDALSHQIPDGDFEEVVEEGFKLILERHCKRKALTARPRAQRERPRESPTQAQHREASPRYVPAALKRAVWKRDGAKCSWPMGDGHVCGSTRQLQFDHDTEVALAGRSTLENLRLLCRTHNLMKAEMHLGRALMARFRKRPAVPAGAGEATERPSR